MRQWIAALVLASLQVSAFPTAVSDVPELHATSAVIVSEDGQLIYGIDPDRSMPMASTTKLMTALIAAETMDPDREINIKEEWCGIEGSSMYLRPDERYTVRELLTGLLLASGNDAVVALACCCAGDIKSFAGQMNSMAAALGMRHTQFQNPHGLPEEGHYASAGDLAILMTEVMRHDLLADLMCAKTAEIHGRVLLNHNQLLGRYAGCIGGKTGYTTAAGRCLVSCAEREGLRLICVTLDDPDDWNDHERLYDWAFSHFELRQIDEDTAAFEVPVLGGLTKEIHVAPEHSCRVLTPRDAELKLAAQLPFYVFAPISKGASAGTVKILLENEPIAELALVYEESVATE